MMSLTCRYAGFRPQLKWRYGDTFGNDTAKYFQQRRSLALASSIAKDSGMGWDTKVKLPSVYSNVPDLVLGARSRDRDRMLGPIKYTLLNHHERDEHIRDFLTVTMVTGYTQSLKVTKLSNSQTRT